MIPVYLTQIKTSDAVTLDGIVVVARKKDTALIWLHGLSSKFYGGQDLIAALSAACLKNNIGYFKFNTRGRDVVYRDGKKYFGGGFEKFTDCVSDIQAMIQFAKKLGYKRTILAGHSTGANKALYYIYKTRDPAVKGIILAGPISDRAGAIQQRGIKKVDVGVKLAEELKKKKIKLMPPEYGIMGPERYISLYKSVTAEDVFPYHNPKAAWKELSSVRVPILTVVGGKDEYLDRPAKELIETFQNHAPLTKSFTGVSIKGANHGFEKKEKELAVTIIDWIKTL